MSSTSTTQALATAEMTPPLFGDPNLCLFNSGDHFSHNASQSNGASGYVGRHRVDADIH